MSHEVCAETGQEWKPPVSPEIQEEMERNFGKVLQHGVGKRMPDTLRYGDKRHKPKRIEPLPDDVKLIPKDSVVLPSHYSRFPVEPVYFSRVNQLSGNEMNIVKYALRAPYKHPNIRIDYSKAIRSIVMECKYRLGDPDWWKPYKTAIAECLEQEFSYAAPKT
jgi:hypothetical protein